jgi:hypothetical protein
LVSAGMAITRMASSLSPGCPVMPWCRPVRYLP